MSIIKKESPLKTETSPLKTETEDEVLTSEDLNQYFENCDTSIKMENRDKPDFRRTYPTPAVRTDYSSLLNPPYLSHQLHYKIRDWWWNLTTPQKIGDHFTAAYVLKCKINGISTEQFLRMCLNVSIQANEPQLFENEVIFSAVTRAWRLFAIQIHVFLIIFMYVIWAVIISFNCQFHQGLYENEKLWLYGEICAGFTSILLLRDICHFVCLIEKKEPIKRYFTNLVIDFLAYFLTIAGTVVRLANKFETETSAALMSLATLFMFLQGLLLLRPFFAFGPVIRTAFIIFQSTFPIVVLLFVINVGFSQSFFILSFKNTALDSHYEGSSLLHTFIYMMGQANWENMSNTSTPWLSEILMIFFLLLTSILTINLIIAKMNFVYGQVTDNIRGEWKRQQCELVLEYFGCFFERFSRINEEREKTGSSNSNLTSDFCTIAAELFCSSKSTSCMVVMVRKADLDRTRNEKQKKVSADKINQKISALGRKLDRLLKLSTRLNHEKSISLRKRTRLAGHEK